MDRRQFLAGSAVLMTTAVWASSVDKLLALDSAQRSHVSLGRLDLVVLKATIRHSLCRFRVSGQRS